MARKPSFLHELISAKYYVGAAAVPFDGTAVTYDGGTITYQWQVSENKVDWSDIVGANNPTYTPSTADVSNRFYRVIATNTAGGLYPADNIYPDDYLYPADDDSTATAYSNIATILVESPQIIFVSQPISMQYIQNEIPNALFAYAKYKNETITYQWQVSENGTTWQDIPQATSNSYLVATNEVGTKYYRVKASVQIGDFSTFAFSKTAIISVLLYEDFVKMPFIKATRIRFLQPDGSTAFALDNNDKNKYSASFIADGNINVNMQNGTRRTANVILSNTDSQFDYNVNHLWFGTEIALDEGFILPSGKPYYIQQAVLVVRKPTEHYGNAENTAEYDLTDKWAKVDGTLGGNLEGTYEVAVGTNIFTPIATLLAEDKGNGQPVDNMRPVFTEYYNGKTQTLPDGTQAPMANSPYTLRVDNDSGTIAIVINGLCEMVNAWYGYDQNGALRIDPSQDDILDTSKPIQWRFSMDEVELIEMDYESDPSAVYNDYIVLGEILGNQPQPCGRATNYDPNSDTNVNIIGRKTYRVKKNGFGTVKQCQDYAEWKLKRSAALQKTVTISCSQLFHIVENQLIEIVRTDKKGSPIERYLVTGFSRPLQGNGLMTITAVSVTDFPIATISTWNP